MESSYAARCHGCCHGSKSSRLWSIRPDGWAKRYAGMLAAFGLPSNLRNFGIPQGRLREIAEKSSGNSMRGNPKELSTEERIAILSRVV